MTKSIIPAIFRPAPAATSGAPSTKPAASASPAAPATPNDKLKETRKQVDDVVEVMKDNIRKAIDRDEKILVLEGKSEEILANATVFERVSRRLKRKFWWKNAKFTVTLAVVAGVVIATIVLVVVL
eukprot:m.236871 g.236871  ORF g.236871 m.236871 type:complete len:126 (+) comp13047_c0_seq1:44-421(+)